MLILHFMGLSMGLGTSFGYMFLGIAGSELEGKEAKKFMLSTFALSRMGNIGLTLLVITGGYLITPYLKVLSSQPFLIAKLCLVAVLIVLIIILNQAAKKAKLGDVEKQLKKIQLLGKFSMLTAILIVIMAVLNFH